jgi:hypothetical protein
MRWFILAVALLLDPAGVLLLFAQRAPRVPRSGELMPRVPVQSWPAAS